MNVARRRPDKIILHARKAILLAPSFAPPHGFLAIGLAQDGQPVAALQAFRQAIRLDPRMGETALVWSMRATMFQQIGRTDEAVLLWEQAREANADLILPRLELADYYVRNGRTEEARVLAGEIRRVNPEMTADFARQVAGRAMARGPEAAFALGENMRRAGLP